MGIIGILGLIILGFWLFVVLARWWRAQGMVTKPQFIGGNAVMWVLFLVGVGLIALDYLVL